MAARVRNSEWEDDIELMNDLKENVSRNLRQSEIVDLMKVKYPMYSWSLRTLSRRLHHFGIRYTDLCLITSFYHSEILSIVACGGEDYKHSHKIVDCSGDLLFILTLMNNPHAYGITKHN